MKFPRIGLWSRCPSASLNLLPTNRTPLQTTLYKLLSINYSLQTTLYPLQTTLYPLYTNTDKYTEQPARSE